MSDLKISELPPADPLSGAELTAVVQDSETRQSTVSAFVAGVSGVILQDGSVAFTADQSMGSHKLTNVTDPTSAQDAATKAYVDALATGINQLTGDGTAGPGSGSQALTLATVNSNVGAFTNANITVNAKGLVTAAANGTAGAGASASLVMALIFGG